MPEASLVAPVDVSERPVLVNEDLVNELLITRQQRDICAARIDGVREWRNLAEKEMNQ